ncbi:MAG TPA: DUF305 domain-containing protein [Thermomicrobiales bacterium]|jgi:uncharacterized protein (DUF305 family)|nr:DUF305 domain-containing protein [Thermomicrobiales bacterium]
MPTRDTLMRLALIALVPIAFVAGVFSGRTWDPGSGLDEAAQGFLRDMVTHHGQAVAMSFAVYPRTESDDIRFMTYDMGTTQQAQIGMMIQQLDSRDAPQTSSEPPMTWMGHPTNGLMPGMATQEQLALLQTLPPAEADVLLLQLMIVHHRGGVMMAEALLERSDNPEARRLAESILRSQDVEILNMNAMLEARGQPPVDDMTVPAWPQSLGGATPAVEPVGTPTHGGHGG